MKKVIMLLVVWSMLEVSCDNQETIKPENDFDEIISNFNSMYRTGLEYQVKNLRKFSTFRDGIVEIDYDGLNRLTADKLNSQFFGGAFNPFDVLTNAVRPKSNSLRYEDGLVYSEAQQAVIDDYAGQMSYVTDPYSAQYVVQGFQNTIIYSDQFTYDEQVQLIAVVQAGDILSDYVLSGRAAQDMGLILGGYYGEDYVTMGCSVDWRSVWGGAVVGLVSNAVRGAIVGGAGGTVALPLVGTVTGAVGGAVFGGAAGFVGGAIGGIAGNLLLTCFR